MLGVSVLEDLIRISSEGPPVADFDPVPQLLVGFHGTSLKGNAQDDHTF